MTHDFRRHNEDVRRSGAQAQVLSGAIQPSMNFVNNLGYVLVAVVGCLRVLAGGRSIGELRDAPDSSGLGGTVRWDPHPYIELCRAAGWTRWVG